MVKYADDTYLIIPAFNFRTCAAEIAHIEDWALKNNLTLNRVKSMEIVFVSPRSRRDVTVPPPAVPGIVRTESLKVLGVTLNRRFSVEQHITHLLASCAQTLFALRTLRNHGLPTTALHIIFQATVVAKLCYASPAWWGFTSAADRGRLEAFFRRAVQFGYRDASAPSLTSLFEQADDKLFHSILCNSRHLLYSLLPPKRTEHYSLRERAHNLQLSIRTSALCDNNFIIRSLFKDICSSQFSQVV